MYLHLFNRCSDAVNLLESGKESESLKLLIEAQNECEEMFCSDEDNEIKNIDVEK